MADWERVESPTVRLRQAMAETGKKQIDLVQETGLNRGTISRYLAGKYEPKLEAVKKLAKALNVSEMWLWGHDVPKERTEIPLISPEDSATNDTVTQFVYRMYEDEAFLMAVEKLIEMDDKQLADFARLDDKQLDAFMQLFSTFDKE